MGTRRRVCITGKEEEGKGVGRALVEGDRESGQSVNRERKRKKRNTMEILSGDEVEEEGSPRVGKRRRPDQKTSGRAIAQALDPSAKIIICVLSVPCIRRSGRSER